jgi:putative PIN family toxin of toxin-antitoxin system
MRVNRFVLDTNIWISYFITNNHQRIIDIIDLYEIDIFSCDELISEFSKVLGYEHIKKYRLNVRKAVKLLNPDFAVE